MNDTSKKKPAQGDSAAKEAERRRIGTVVHDERGNASVSWRDAPPGERRPVLEILSEPKLSVKNEETYDPYARGGPRGGLRDSPTPGERTRTDLRRLSDWIKMMRELEERKKSGGGGDGK
ncbi:MAG: hypothetical protein WAK94_07655 [Steroidobacteraceae bacterium]